MSKIDNYKKLIRSLSKPESGYDVHNAIFSEIQTNNSLIEQQQLQNIQKAALYELLNMKLNKIDQKFGDFYDKLISLLYKLNSGLLKIIYEFIPCLIQKFIQTQHKIDSLNACVVTIYNNEFINYNKEGDKRSEILASFSIQQLYQKHMLKQLSTQQWHYASKIEQMTNTNRHNIKALLLWLWYNHLDEISDNSIIQYFNSVYIYCGGNIQETQNGVSLYLLEKKNKLNLFQHTISQQQLQWILITLYDLAIRKQNFKYQILAAINMVHKKAANQCQFRLSQIAQSVIHLLEDQYTDIF